MVLICTNPGAPQDDPQQSEPQGSGDPEMDSVVIGRMVGQASKVSGSGSFWDLVVARYQ
jgi:hypothetical protein